MTLAGSTVTTSPSEDDASRRGGRPAPHVVVLGLLALLLLGVLAWNRVAVHRAEQVQVRWSGDPDCRGARVVDHTVDSATAGEDTRSGPLIRAERGMRCMLTVEVTNRSGGTVHLGEAQLPFMGPGGGAVLKVDTTTEPDAWTVAADTNVDLARTLDTALGPDETVSFDIPIVFRDRGCSGGVDGGTVTTTQHGFPTVTVDYLLHSFERRPENDLVHLQAGPARGCGAG